MVLGSQILLTSFEYFIDITRLAIVPYMITKYKIDPFKRTILINPTILQ